MKAFWRESARAKRVPSRSQSDRLTSTPRRRSPGEVVTSETGVGNETITRRLFNSPFHNPAAWALGVRKVQGGFSEDNYIFLLDNAPYHFTARLRGRDFVYI